MPRVLLTGATGFIGSHVVRKLLARGCDLALIVRPQSDKWRIADLLPRLEVIHVDLANLPCAAGGIRAFAPDVTIHLAWSGVGNRCRDDTEQTANLQATLSLFEIARQAGSRTWIGMGSQAEYGIQDRVIDETMSTDPKTMYGATKLCACLLTRQLCALAGGRFVWLRLFTCYGPAEGPSWLIPYVTTTLLKRARPALTCGEQRYDYLYVEDVAEAVAQVVYSPNTQGIFNLGSGEARTVRSVVERIRDLIDPELPLGFGEVPYRPDQIMLLQADTSRLRAATGWAPTISVEEGLKRTVDWYRHTRAAGD